MIEGMSRYIYPSVAKLLILDKSQGRKECLLTTSYTTMQSQEKLMLSSVMFKHTLPYRKKSR